MGGVPGRSCFSGDSERSDFTVWASDGSCELDICGGKCIIFVRAKPSGAAKRPYVLSEVSSCPHLQLRGRNFGISGPGGLFKNRDRGNRFSVLIAFL